MNCKKCGTEILEANAVFCSKCGQRLDGKKSCKKCGKIVDETDSFCPFCGEKFKGKEKNEKFFNTERLKKVSLLGDVSFFIGVCVSLLFVLFLGVGRSNIYGDGWLYKKNITLYLNIFDTMSFEWTHRLNEVIDSKTFSEQYQFNYIAENLSLLLLSFITFFGVILFFILSLIGFIKKKKFFNKVAVITCFIYICGATLYFILNNDQLSYSGFKEIVHYNKMTKIGLTICCIFLGIGYLLKFIVKSRELFEKDKITMLVYSIITLTLLSFIFVLAKNSTFVVKVIRENSIENVSSIIGKSSIISTNYDVLLDGLQISQTAASSTVFLGIGLQIVVFLIVMCSAVGIAKNLLIFSRNKKKFCWINMGMILLFSVVYLIGMIIYSENYCLIMNSQEGEGGNYSYDIINQIIIAIIAVLNFVQTIIFLRLNKKQKKEI